MLVNRLVDHILGKVEMSPSQVRSAEILLRKTLPDLTAIDMDAQVNDNKAISSEAMSVAAWLTHHSQQNESDLHQGESGEQLAHPQGEDKLH